MKQLCEDFRDASRYLGWKKDGKKYKEHLNVWASLRNIKAAITFTVETRRFPCADARGKYVPGHPNGSVLRWTLLLWARQYKYQQTTTAQLSPQVMCITCKNVLIDRLSACCCPTGRQTSRLETTVGGEPSSTCVRHWQPTCRRKEWSSHPELSQMASMGTAVAAAVEDAVGVFQESLQET